MRNHLPVSLMLVLVCTPAFACDLIPPRRQPTLAEKLGGVKEIFGGTVVGYVTSEGTRLMGPPPPECRDEHGYYEWREDQRIPECSTYADVTEALFKVDVPIVGAAAGEIASYSMHWGDGDCDQDFAIGEKWLIAGPHVIEELWAPIRDDEIAALRRLAAYPLFDMSRLYR